MIPHVRGCPCERCDARRNKARTRYHRACGQADCQVCSRRRAMNREPSRRHYERNRESERERNRAGNLRRKRTPDGWALKARNCLRSRARREGCDLSTLASPEELLTILRSQGFKCAISGIRLVFDEYADHLRHPFSPSIDHKVPSSRGGGHSAANIQVVALAVNSAKGELTDAEFRPLWSALEAHIRGEAS